MVAEPGKLPNVLEIPQGATWDKLFTWQAVNLTGWTGLASFESLDIVPTITYTNPDSTIYVKLTPAQTLGLPTRGRFVLDLTDPSGNIQRLLIGQFVLAEDL